MLFLRSRLGFSLATSFATPLKALKVAHSDIVGRARFHNGSEVFSTPSSTLLTPSSWPPRPDSSGLNPTCVADHVVTVSTLNASDDLQTPCRCTRRDDLGQSPMVLLTIECEGGVYFEFLQVGPYLMKRRAIYFENLCSPKRVPIASEYHFATIFLGVPKSD